MPGCLTLLRRLWVDGGYVGADFASQAGDHRPKVVVEAVKRSASAQGFEVLPRRRVAKRTFGWLMRHHRLVRDHEHSAASANACVSVAMIRLMLRRLA